jgi:DNA-directed RNA polymerase specialized sigma24 family protein
LESSFEQRQPAARLRDDRDWRERLADWARGTEPEIKAPRGKPGLEPKPHCIGICCSGGGIRSAAYNLGALQVLQEEKILGAAQYVAAVSGGSYIAASYATVASESNIGDDDPPVYAPGSPEEQHLRNHSNYMAPGPGGQIRFLLRVVLGLLVNLAFVSGVLLVFGRLLGWLYADVLHPELNRGSGASVEFEWWTWAIALSPLAMGVGLAVPDLLRRLRNDGRRRWLEAWSTRLIGIGLLLYVMLIALPWTLDWIRDDGPDTLLDGTASDVGAAQGSQLFGFINVAAVIAALAGSLRAFVARKRSWFALGAGAVAGPLIVLTTFGLFVNEASLRGWSGVELLWLALGVAVMALWFVGDLTQWSLHPFYRRRLSSAFFIRRTTPEQQAAGAGPVQELPFSEPLYLSTLDTGKHFPTLIVCAAANVSDEGVTPPGRYAASFTFSSDEVGGLSVGVVPTAAFEKLLKIDGKSAGSAARDVTLPAAVAMSGAAVSPSMGKHSIRALTFLLGLTNVRLGVWIPNPRWVEKLAARRRVGHLRPPPWYLWHELLGRNKVNHKYLYISDGGHFENLGLVELLRRGCTTIFCFDASGDRVDTFNTLGEAVALARTEVQVDVEIEPKDMRPDPGSGLSTTDYVIGTFRYLNAAETQDDDGILIFAKAAVTEDAPWDVRAFREADKRFPNHSTFDQLFDDQKFESYRALGAHTARRAVRAWMERIAKQTARDQLIRVARERRQITYGELVERTDDSVPDPVKPPPDLKPLLRELDEEEVAENRPPLSTLIVHETPFNRNQRLRRMRVATADRRRADQLRRVWDHWSATPMPREELSGEPPGGVPQPV